MQRCLVDCLLDRRTDIQTDRAMYAPVNHRVSCLFTDFHDFRYFAYTCSAYGFLLPTCMHWQVFLHEEVGSFGGPITACHSV